MSYVNDQCWTSVHLQVLLKADCSENHNC